MVHILEDPGFWTGLAYSASGWLSLSSDKEHRRCWIDDFLPSTMRRTNAAAKVAGTAWVMRQNAGIKCDFLATIPWRIVNRARDYVEIAHIEIDLNKKVVEVELRRIADLPDPDRVGSKRCLPEP